MNVTAGSAAATLPRCERRTGVLKRRHRLHRCRCHGIDGMTGGSVLV